MSNQIVTAVVVLVVLLAIGGFGYYYYFSRKSSGMAYVPYPNSNPICPVESCDIANGTVAASEDECLALCTDDKQCNVALFDRNNRFKDANCWLKHFDTLPPNSEKAEGFDFFVKNN